MLGRAVALGDAPRCRELGAVALPVVDGETEALEVLAPRPRQRRRRIEPAGKKND